MNRDQFEGKWHELKGKVRETWGKLTEDDVSQIHGKWEQLSGKLQKKYGWAKDHAEREIQNWYNACEEKHKMKDHNDMSQQWRDKSNDHEPKHPRKDENHKKRKAS